MVAFYHSPTSALSTATDDWMLFSNFTPKFACLFKFLNVCEPAKKKAFHTATRQVYIFSSMSPHQWISEVPACPLRTS